MKLFFFAIIIALVFQTHAEISASGSEGINTEHNCECKVASANGNYCQKWKCAVDRASDCFPSFGIVTIHTSNGKKMKIPMKDIKVGDCVKDHHINDSCSQVTTISHLEQKKKTIFAQIKTKNHIAHVTFDHIIPTLSHWEDEFDYSAVNGKHVGDLELGELIMTISGPEMVEEIQFVISEGIYSPHTISGTIIVDDVMFSTYSGINNHIIAHWFFSFYNSFRNTNIDVNGDIKPSFFEEIATNTAKRFI